MKVFAENRLVKQFWTGLEYSILSNTPVELVCFQQITNKKRTLRLPFQINPTSSHFLVPKVKTEANSQIMLTQSIPFNYISQRQFQGNCNDWHDFNLSSSNCFRNQREHNERTLPSFCESRSANNISKRTFKANIVHSFEKPISNPIGISPELVTIREVDKKLNMVTLHVRPIEWDIVPDQDFALNFFVGMVIATTSVSNRIKESKQSELRLWA